MGVHWNVWTLAALTCSSNWQAFAVSVQFPRAVSTSSPHRKRPLGNANANRVMVHYAHVDSATKESDVCNAFMHTPRARIPHNEARRGRSCPRVSQKGPRHVFPLFGHPYRRADSNPDFSHAQSRFPIERFVPVHCYTWSPFWKI